MIFIVGDIHGHFDHFWNAVQRKIDQCGQVPSMIIQVGDFGIYSPDISQWTNPLNIPVYFIEGNHEDFDMLKYFEPRDNLHYIPRGSVLEIEGKLFAFCGVAESVDKFYRNTSGPRKNWWVEERVTREDIEKVIVNLVGCKPDYLITHAAPSSVIATHFPRLDTMYWGLPANWKDDSAIIIQELWDTLDRPKLICGHMHRSIQGPDYKILGILEVEVIE